MARFRRVLAVAVGASLGWVAAGVTAFQPTPGRPASPPPAQPRPAEKAIHAVVSIPPLKGLVEPLLPHGSTVEVLIPPGVSEHGYELPPSKLAALAKADLVVYVGLGLEPQVATFVREHASEARKDVCFADAAGVNAEPDHPIAPAPQPRQPADGDGHEHAAGDPHLWLDPVMALRLQRTVEGALEHSLGSDRAAQRALGDRAAALEDRIREIDDRCRALSKAPHRTIVVAHNAYGWLAKRYHLDVVPIAGLTASEPTPSAIAEAARAVKEKGVKAIFVEPQLSPAAAKRIAQATGVKVLTLDPLGDGDWFKMMSSNLDALEAALLDPPPRPANNAAPKTPAP